MTSPDDLLDGVPRMREALADAGWSAGALDELLGPQARSHLERDELAPLLRRTAGHDPLSTLARLFVLGVPVDGDRARRAGVPPGWLSPEGSAKVRLQAVRHGGVEVLCAHDAGRAATGVARDQVLGVGAASLTLAAATPRRLVGRALDIGTGCGVQALLAGDHSATVVATDSNPRAAAYAGLSAALNDLELDVRVGDLLGPVAGERFDLVVSNPPFVVGSGRPYTYRDSGLPGDELCRRLVRAMPKHLSDDGMAVLLTNWLHPEGDDRVRSWFDGTGCDAWVVQRELAAPEDYVTAWLRDTDEGPRFDALYEAWMDALAGVEAIAFGVIAMTPGAGEVVIDEVDQQLASAWGEQVWAHFAARRLPADLRDARLRLREDVRLHSIATTSDGGWQVEAQVLQQSEGLRFSGGVDTHGATLLAGCDGTRRLGDLIAVLASSLGLSDAEAADQVVPVVRRLVEQGFLVL